MAVVKGSRQDDLVILQHKPGYKLRRNVYLVLSALIIGFGCYLLGFLDSVQKIQDLSQAKLQLETQLAKAEENNSALRQRVGVLEKGSEVDRKAADTIRQSVVGLKAQVASLEEEVVFYKGIMAPSDNERGLKINKIDIVPFADSDNRYRYSIKLMQVVDNSTFVSGNASIRFVGIKDGEQYTFALRDLDSEVSDLDIRFRFRYFQELSGEIVIPSDFTPTEIQIVLQATGNKRQRLEQVLEWPH